MRSMLLILLSGAVLMACNESEFTSPSGTEPKSEPEPRQLEASLEESSQQVPAIRQDQCWFAVSGTWIGYDRGAGNETWFPGTISGDPVAHGASFDMVGGVYLNARQAPYVENSGAREIDIAIDKTFDSIIVAPGMSVVISDELGNTMFEGEGGFWAQSEEEYLKHPDYLPPYDYETYMRESADLGSYPQWMQDYLETSKIVPIALHAATQVSVSAIAGGECDSSNP